MMTKIGQTLAVLTLAMSLASGAYAVGNHPCKAEHQTAKTACASDTKSPDCKQARKAVKSCRVANGLPVHKHVNKPLSSGATTGGASSGASVPSNPPATETTK